MGVLRYVLLLAGVTVACYGLFGDVTGRLGFTPYGLVAAILCCLAMIVNKAANKAANKHPHEMIDE